MALVIILVIKKIIPHPGDFFLPKNKTPPRNKVSTQRETQPATRTQQVPHLAGGGGAIPGPTKMQFFVGGCAGVACSKCPHCGAYTT